MDQKDLDSRFTYHPPVSGRDVLYTAIRAKAKEMAELINALCPEGREKSLAVTHLEEAVFWSNASIARGTLRSEQKKEEA
jgi:hypothetical protein